MNENQVKKPLSPAEEARMAAEEAKRMAAEARTMSREAKEKGIASLPARKKTEPSGRDGEAVTPQQTHPAPKSTPPQSSPEAVKKLEKRHSGARGYRAAAVLSSCSILLLLSIFLCAALGLFPMSGGNVQLQVSGGGMSQAEASGKTDMLADFMNSVVIVNSVTRSGSGIGTGIILSSDGYIATNYHVVESATSLTVGLYDGKELDAKVVGFTEIDDLAVLKVEATGLRPATFAKQENARVGEDVFAVGCPEGAEFAWSVTKGIISALDREIKIYDDEGILEKKMYVVQTDASVNPGNSGGPLINDRGEVVGIITLKLSDSAGMGFAIPSDGALEIITAIIETGNADNVNSSVSKGRPLIGITGVGVVGGTWYANYTENGQSGIMVITEAEAAADPENTFYAAVDGVHVSATTKGLDAANHLQVNDIITEADGIPVYDIYQLMAVINEKDGGDPVKIKFYRDGDYKTVTITLGTAAE